jgi:hypothetical protein
VLSDPSLGFPVIKSTVSHLNWKIQQQNYEIGKDDILLCDSNSKPLRGPLINLIYLKFCGARNESVLYTGVLNLSPNASGFHRQMGNGDVSNCQQLADYTTHLL